jgi:hypothetical protein
MADGRVLAEAQAYELDRHNIVFLTNIQSDDRRDDPFAEVHWDYESGTDGSVPLKEAELFFLPLLLTTVLRTQTMGPPTM